MATVLLLLLVALLLPAGRAFAEDPVDSLADPEAQAPLDMIERFVDRSEDFWREPAGTYAANGPGVTQPRGIGNIALAYATLLTERPEQAQFGDEGHSRDLMLARVDSAIRVAANTNKGRGGTWGGGTWQAALETHNWALAAYLLRDQLSAQTLQAVRDVVIYESNILITKPIANGTRGNTTAEDNAWNSPLPVLAAGWWPDHANAAKWRQAASLLAMNSATKPGDRTDAVTVVEGRPLSFWARSENLLPDLTMENHGFFNPLYQQAAPLSLGEGILAHQLTGQRVPETFEFRTEQIYDAVLAPLVTPDGDLLLSHGQDWVAKDYQHLAYFTMMGTWFDRPDAAAYAERAREAVARRQDARTDGSFLGQAPLGYESMLAGRLTAAYLMHQNLGGAAQTDAAGLADIEATREGVHHYAASKLAVHRREGTVRSVNWTTGQPTALLIPDGQRHDDPVLVHYQVGSLIGSAAKGVTAASCECREDSFAVAQVVGGRGFAVASLENGLMPALEAGAGETFTVTLERISGVTGGRPVNGPSGPLSGTSQDPWFNAAERLGMVVLGGAGIDVRQGIGAGENRIDRITGSVAGGDGRRAAVLLADHSDVDVAQVATTVERPSHRRAGRRCRPRPSTARSGSSRLGSPGRPRASWSCRVAPSCRRASSLTARCRDGRSRSTASLRPAPLRRPRPPRPSRSLPRRPGPTWSSSRAPTTRPPTSRSVSPAEPRPPARSRRAPRSSQCSRRARHCSVTPRWYRSSWHGTQIRRSSDTWTRRSMRWSPKTDRWRSTRSSSRCAPVRARTQLLR